MKARKVLSLILAIAMVLTTFTVIPLTANAEESMFTSVTPTISNGNFGVIVNMPELGGHNFTGLGDGSNVLFIAVKKSDAIKSGFGDGGQTLAQVLAAVIGPQAPTQEDMADNFNYAVGDEATGEPLPYFLGVGQVTQAATDVPIVSDAITLPAGTNVDDYLVIAWSANDPRKVEEKAFQVDKDGIVVNRTDTHIEWTAGQVGDTAVYGSSVTPYTADVYEGTADTSGTGTKVGSATITYDASSDVPTDAGTYTVTASFAQTDTHKAASATKTLTITQASTALEWITQPSGKTYDGSALTAVAKLKDTSNSRDVSGATITYKYTGTTSGNGLPTNAGTYNITASYDGADGNYATPTALTESNVTIAQATLSGSAPTTVTLTPGSELTKNQTGTVAGNLTGVSGNVAGTFTWTYEGTTVPSVEGGQTYNVKWTFVPTAQADKDNYNYAAWTGTGTIAGAAKTAKAVSMTGASFTYNGSAQGPTVTVADLTEGVGADQFTVTYTNRGGETYNQTTAPTNAGDYTATVALNAGAAAKYTLTGTTTLDFTIAKADTTLTLSDADSFVYDGTAKTPTIAVTYGSSQTVSTGFYSVSYSNTNGGANNNANAGTVTVTIAMNGTAGQGVNFNAPATKTFTIGAKPLTVDMTGVTLSKAYDGNDSVAGAIDIADKATAIVGGDTVSVSSTSIKYDNKNVGTGKTITASGIALDGADKANYSISATATVSTGVITAKAITATAKSGAVTKTYDGNTTVTGKTVNDVFEVATGVSGEALTLTGDIAFNDANVANANAINATNLVLANGTGGTAANYSLTADTAAKSSDVTITTATPNITGTEAITSGVFVGAGYDLPTSSYKVQGVNNADITSAFTFAYAVAGNQDGTTGAATIDSATGKLSPTAEGKVKVTVSATPSGSPNANYANPASVDFIVTIGAQGGNGLSVSPNAAQTVQYGDTVDLVISTTTAANDNTITVQSGDIDKLTVAPKAGTTDGQVGTYTVTVKGNTGSANITIHQDAKGAIGAADLTVTFNMSKRQVTINTASVTHKTKVYDKDVNVGPTSFAPTELTVNNIVSGDTVTVTAATAKYADQNAGGSKTINFTGITISDTTKYVLTSDTASIADGTISKKDITVAGKDLGAGKPEKAYDGTKTVPAGFNLGNSVEFTGVISDDTVTLGADTAYKAEYTSEAANDNASISVTGYKLTDASGNYNLTTTSALSIPAKITKVAAELTGLSNKQGAYPNQLYTLPATSSYKVEGVTVDTVRENLTEHYDVVYKSVSGAGAALNSEKTGFTATGEDTVTVTVEATKKGSAGAAAGNYTDTAITGTFTVKVSNSTPNNLAVKGQDNVNKTDDFTVTLKYGDTFTVVANDGVTANGGAPVVAKTDADSNIKLDGNVITALNHENSGTVTVSSAASSDGSVLAKTITITVVLEKKELAGTVSVENIQVGGTPNATAAFTNLVTGDTFTAGTQYEIVYKNSAGETAADFNTPGEYTAEVALKTDATANHYSLPTAGIKKTFTVSAIPAQEVKLIFEAADKVFDETAYADSNVTVTLTGSDSEPIEGATYTYEYFTYEEPAVEGGQPTLTSLDAAPVDAGSYAVKVTVVGNYTLHTDSTDYALFAITPASLAPSPEVLKAADASAFDAKDGKITGLDRKRVYEYKKSDADEWTMLDEGTEEITDLVPGSYYVRYPIPQISAPTVDDPDATVNDPNYDANSYQTLVVGPSETKVVTIQYKANGGTLSSSVPSDYTVNAGDTVTVKGTAKKSGSYRFDGWRNSMNNSLYQNGDTFKVPADYSGSTITLTAIYVRTNGGGGGGGSSSGGGNYLNPIINNSKSHSAYIKGYEDGSFRPENNITRAETATIFARVNDTFKEGNAYLAKFNDVPNAEWYYNYVGFTSTKGMVNGYEDGSFQPDGNITRAEFAAIAARSLNLGNTGSSSFDDVKGHWAEGYIAQLVSQGIINGYEDGTFRPDAQITRAEAVKIVNGVLGRKVTAAGLENASFKTFSDVSTNNWAYYEIVEASNDHKYTTSDDTENWK